ncbi:MAG: sigma-70 family RNA polymerase sigma factor [Acidobacteriota bacterium]
MDRLSRFFCRESRMSEQDVDDFIASVRLHFLDRDFAVLRSFEERCSLSTFLSMVIQRQLFDYRSREWGRFRTSAAAQRLGPVGVRLETLLRRDRKSLPEAVTVLQREGHRITRDEADSLAEKLPERRPRLVQIEIEEALPRELAVGSDAIELEAEAHQRQAVSRTVTAVMRAALAELPAEDLTILRMHYAAGMPVAAISRSLGLEQRPTYRRINRLCQGLRAKLADAGLSEVSVEALLGRPDVDLDFGLREMENPEDATSTDVEGNMSR